MEPDRAPPSPQPPEYPADAVLPTSIEPPDVPVIPVKIDWTLLGLENDEMAKFASFISTNLTVALDAAQGTNFRIMASLNQRLGELERSMKSETDDKRKAGLARDYREVADLALKASNQVTASGYTRIKANAMAIDAGRKRTRKPGFVKQVGPEAKS